MKKYAFSYKVKEVNIQDGHILVEYTPVDETLTSYSYNLPTFTRNESGELKTLDEVISEFAPHDMWESQELLKSVQILNTTGVITPKN